MGDMFRDMPIDGIQVPLIQTLVVSTSDKLPGAGISEFIPSYNALSNDKKKDIVHSEFRRIFEFGTRWEKVLSKLNIEPTKPSESEIEKPRIKIYNPYGSEGSPEHVALRDYVANTPESIGLDGNLVGIPEYPLKSGDKIDVVFETEDEIIGVEVKSIRSGVDDIQRGLYQCIKYEAVLKAESQVNKVSKSIRCILVLQNSLPRKLSRVRNILGIDVRENIVPKT